MDNLENNKWKEFKIKDLFITFNGINGLQVPTGAYINKKDLYSSNIPRITVRDTNNGVDSFSSSNSKNLKVFENFISVSFLGSVFYHPYKASLDMKVHCLQLIDRELNKYLAKFLIIAIKNNIKNSSYGNQLSSTDLPQKKILIPIDENEQPNYNYMEQYIKEIEKKQLKEYYDYVTKELESLDKLGGVTTNVEISWKEFLLKELFIIKKGNQNNMAKLSSGNIPLVSAKKFNNGYKDFMSENEKGIYPKNILTLNNDGDGGAGISYYQPSKMLLDTHVTALIPKYENANKYNLLFMACCITKQREKFGHGYSLNNERLNNFKFMLPIKKDNKIDFDYIEKYVIFNIRKMLIQYVDYMKERIL